MHSTEWNLIQTLPTENLRNGDNKLDPEHGTGESVETEPTTLHPGQVLKDTGFELRELKSVVYGHDPSAEDIQILEEYLAQGAVVPGLDLTPRDVTRWKMAWCEIQKRSPADQITFALPKDIVKRCKDWPDEKDMLRFPIALAFSAAALIYGGLHALAWHANFKSPTEQLLWRISACIVMGGMPLLLLIAKLEDEITGLLESFTKSIDVMLDYYLYAILLFLPFSAYVLARAYLVVECFINLAHLPAEVYDVPSWASYFPHIS